MQWILLGSLFFCASFFHGITGFGFGIIALPLLIIFSDPHESVITVMTLGTINVIYLAIKTRHKIPFKMVKRVLIFSLAGLPCGLFFFLRFTGPSLRIAISLLSASFGLILLSKVSFRFRNEKLAESCVGFLSGFFQTSVGLAGIPPAVYLTLQSYEKLIFRAGINALFLFLMPCALVLFWFFSHIDTSAFLRGIPFIPIVILGQHLGMKSIKVFSQATFNKIVILTIMVSGIYTLTSTLLS
jgi:uncharacterized membrane protein YfcA